MQDNNLQKVIDSMLAEALNEWAVFSQLCILAVMCVSFIIMWKNNPKQETFYWMLAWIMNLIGIFIIFLVFELNTMSNIVLKSIYILYSVHKFIFALFLMFGAYVFIHQVNIKRKIVVFISAGLSLLFIAIVVTVPLNIISIQALTYFIIGSLFFGSCIHYFNMKKINKLGLFLYGSFMLESILFLHHAWTIYLVHLGEPLPDYMKYMSFYDSLIELVVGMTCLLSISIKEMCRVD